MIAAACSSCCWCSFAGARAREPRSCCLLPAAPPLPAPKHSGVAEGLSCRDRDRDLKKPGWPSLDDEEREEPDPAKLTLNDGDAERGQGGEGGEGGPGLDSFFI